MKTRKTNAQDIPALKALWQEAFGDTPSEIDSFFDTLYPSAIGFCAEEGGEILSMLFALPQTIVKDEKQLKSAYLYAIATRKDARGQGLCTALLAFAEKELRKRYFEAVMLSPASEDLARFYEKLGYRAQGRVTKSKTLCEKAAGQATIIGVQDYAGLRETLLWDTAHVRFDKAQLSYAAAGGEVYCLMAGYDMGCAMTGKDKDGNVFVRELLPSPAVLPALCEKTGTGEYALTSPAEQDAGDVFAMLKWLGAEQPGFEPVYLGLALD